jgi:hypothetical protein
MSYKIEPIDVTGTPKERIIDPRSKKKEEPASAFKWWLAQNDKDLVSQLLGTTEYLKKTNAQRIRQASVFSRLFSGKPLSNFLASNATLDSSNQLPLGRPTANVVYSCTDTVVSRISQDRPNPIFLTDAGHYRERKLSKEANNFIAGELYRTKSHDKGALALRDACVLGDGLLKVFSKDSRVCVDRTLPTELLTDFDDGYYGEPRQIIQMKLADRSVIADMFPDSADIAMQATGGHVDSSPRSTETVSDRVIIAEGWHLPSSKDAKDGRHVVVCSAGLLVDEVWSKDHFPFVKLGYNPTPVGFFSQSLAEILMPGQMEIYRMLIVASQAIELMGVPRIYIDELMKIVETSFNNRIGMIIKGKGPNPPQFLNATSNAPEIYQWIQFLIENAYKISGISSMAATSQKPAGMTSGEAIRSYDDIQTDRLAALSKRYQNVYTDLSYLIVECGAEIAEAEGKYSTIYPGKDGIREIDFKSIDMLKDSFVIKCMEESSLPKEIAGRQSKLSEMLAAQEITPQEFRRLSNFPDLEQSDQLANALEERILSMLDAIVEKGEKGYEQPDPFILDPTQMASTLCVQYINKYSVTDIEEEKISLLKRWWTQLQSLQAQAAPPPQPQPSSPQEGMPPVAPPSPSMSPTSGVQV